jgi:molybdopterin converting factor subunit 1
VQVTVQFFARLRELAGRREWTCEVPDGSTVAQVWHTAALEFPAIVALAGSVSSAVNAEFAGMHSQVTAGDEVAFLPPVSGGAREER